MGDRGLQFEGVEDADGVSLLLRACVKVGKVKRLELRKRTEVHAV